MNDNPFVKPDVQLVYPKRSGAGGAVVVLDRIEPGVTPDYCTHGRVTCYWCPEWCWLGSETYKVVTSGEAAPICLQCATRLIPQASVQQPVGHVEDHRRADGPHP